MVLKTLNKEALLLLSDFWTISDSNVGDFIRDTTTTSKGPLRLTELGNKILEDPQNVQWVLDEGYFYLDATDRTSEELAIRFEIWSKELRYKIQKENAAIDRLNTIAAASTPLILEQYKEILSKGGTNA